MYLIILIKQIIIIKITPSSNNATNAPLKAPNLDSSSII